MNVNKFELKDVEIKEAQNFNDNLFDSRGTDDLQK